MSFKKFSFKIGIILSLFFATVLPTLATDFQPETPAEGYSHALFAPKCGEGDILREFRAYTSCFDGPDDDNGDGRGDLWGIPQWVAYEIKAYPGDLPKIERPGKWITDPELYREGIMPDDDSYRFSKKYRETHAVSYDRGHLCMKQHASRLGEAADWNTHTFYNCVPQRSELNQGIWLNLEKKCGEWADEYGAVWVITGPIVNQNTPINWLGEPGEFPVVIPDAFFKIIVRLDRNRISVMAFIFPQDGDPEAGQGDGSDIVRYAATVDEIEEMTGLNFFQNLDERTESVVESQKTKILWN